MIITVDGDDVVFDTFNELIPWHNRTYGTNHSLDQVHSWLLSDLWDCTEEEAYLRVGRWYQEGECEKLRLKKGARKGIHVLSKRHTLHLVTARPTETKPITLAQFDRHLPGKFEGFHFASHREPHLPTKGQVSKRLGARLHIEDSPRHTLTVIEEGIPVFLFDAPWNQGKMPPQVTRVYSWEEIVHRVAFI